MRVHAWVCFIMCMRLFMGLYVCSSAHIRKQHWFNEYTKEYLVAIIILANGIGKRLLNKYISITTFVKMVANLLNSSKQLSNCQIKITVY